MKDNGQEKKDLKGNSHIEDAPLALLAELTHRCPFQCPYCSNPLELETMKNELTTEEWKRVIKEAGKMGIHQIHFSGGEPSVRKIWKSLSNLHRIRAVIVT